MMIFGLIKKFHSEQRGTSSIEWMGVAAVLLLTLIALSLVMDGMGGTIGQQIVDQTSCKINTWTGGGGSCGSATTAQSRPANTNSQIAFTEESADSEDAGTPVGGPATQTSWGRPTLTASVFSWSTGLWERIQELLAQIIPAAEASPVPQPNSGNQIDWAFIEQQEGNETTGYVPRDSTGQTFGNSGVTIGSGFDLGQHDRAYMERIGIPDRLVDILAPYTGLQRQDAIDYLAANPLTLSAADTRIINERVKTDKAQEIIDAYDAASSVNFADLPVGAQTVIASVAFQYGYLPTRTPRFWGLVTQQDWDGAINELRNFGDDYGPRRNREADYLENNR